MTIPEWIDEFEPLRNPERRKLNGPLRYKECLFEIASSVSAFQEKNIKSSFNIWTLARIDGKQYIVSGIHGDTIEGYFLTKKKPEHRYIIDQIL